MSEARSGAPLSRSQPPDESWDKKKGRHRRADHAELSGPPWLCHERSWRIAEFNQKTRTSDCLRPTSRISWQSACAIVRHARASLTPKAREATATPFRSSPACILGTRHEHRRTPPQRYSGPMGTNASVSGLVVFRFSHIVSHLAVSRQMAKQSANSPLHYRTVEPQGASIAYPNKNTR